ncbi:hypothetical protein [Sphingomonas adhaesiva]|uniref:hypothetical protein n=1 Tax=Sphingomonas adhaesiva TaxID=28212 RepID=UPI002FFD03E6
MTTDEDRPRGPRAMAEDIAGNIATLQDQVEAAECPTEKKRLRRVLRLNREMLAWCKTRRGY